jgi:hypothetical protein
MLFDRIDLRRLRCDIASAAMQCIELKQSLRRTWTRPMADEQRRLLRLRRRATELHVLHARARGRWHVTAPPEGEGEGWDRDAWHARVAERVALDYTGDLGAPEAASP